MGTSSRALRAAAGPFGLWLSLFRSGETIGRLQRCEPLWEGKWFYGNSGLRACRSE